MIWWIILNGTSFGTGVLMTWNKHKALKLFVSFLLPQKIQILISTWLVSKSFLWWSNNHETFIFSHLLGWFLFHRGHATFIFEEDSFETWILAYGDEPLKPSTPTFNKINFWNIYFAFSLRMKRLSAMYQWGIRG